MVVAVEIHGGTVKETAAAAAQAHVSIHGHLLANPSRAAQQANTLGALECSNRQ
jgi:hypothetical protein